jgi:hypothetical protein
MAGSLVLSSGCASLTLAVARTHAKDVITGDIAKTLGIREFRNFLSSQTTASADVPTAASTARPTGNFLALIYQQWHRLPTVVRFFAAGNLGNAGFFYLERQIYRIISLCPVEMVPPFVLEYQDGVSFFVGYLVQIVSTHLLLAVLVYGIDTIDSVEKYYKTLSGQFYAYAFSLLGSTILSTYLLQTGMERTTAFFGTMITFACVNYFLIGWIVRRAVASALSHSKEEKTDMHRLNNKDCVVVEPKTNIRRNDKVLTQRQLKTPTAATKTNDGRLADLIRKVQRGGAFIVGDRKDNHPVLVEPVLWLSLREYVLQTGNPPSTEERFNQNRARNAVIESLNGRENIVAGWNISIGGHSTSALE